MGRWRWIITVAVTASLAACDAGEGTTTDAPPADAELVRRDIDVGGSATDIFLPGGALSADEAAPVWSCCTAPLPTGP